MSAASLREIRSAWNEQARLDHVYAVVSIRSDPMQTLSLDNLPIPRSALASADMVLDIGCGYGRVLIPASIHSPGMLVGIDISDEMLRIAREYSERLNRRPALVHASAHMLPFKANAFDIAYSLLTLQHLPKSLAEGGVHETLRVLKQGGSAWIQFPNALSLQSFVAWILRTIWTKIFRRRLSPAFVRSYTRNELNAIFRKFERIRFRGEDFSILPLSISLRRRRISIAPNPNRILNHMSKLLERESRRRPALSNLASNFVVEARKSKLHPPRNDQASQQGQLIE